MLPFRLIYHEAYNLDLGGHVWPSRKYSLIREHLLRSQFAVDADFIQPSPASDEDIVLVHDRGWVQRLKFGTLTYEEIIRLEIPYSRQMVEAFWLATGGTILAARYALDDGVSFHIGGGFHHAFPGHGEGFCAVHDVAVAIRKLQSERRITRAMVVDCDVHHGNGTAGIFANDASVFTLSIHQLNNYPTQKPPSTLDIHLGDGTCDEEYLSKLGEACAVAVPGFQPDLLVYIAGADPYMEDQLGGLNLTLEGLRERDRLVLDTALRHRVPVAITLAGGYAFAVEDTVAIHCNTALAASDVISDRGWKRPQAPIPFPARQ